MFGMRLSRLRLSNQRSAKPRAVARACDGVQDQNSFADKLRSLKCYVYPEDYHDQRRRYWNDDDDGDEISHSSCSFTFAFSEKIESIIGQKEPSGVLEAHLSHINEQSGNRM